MIIVKIAGGLGNQLFKLNKALELKKFNKNIYIDLSGYESDRFNRKYHFKNKINHLKIFPIIAKKVLIKTNRVLTKLKILMFYAEEVNDLTASNINDKAYIKYLTGSWEENMIPDQENLNILNNLFREKKLKEDNLVAVHFRTKDYDIKLKDNYYLDSLKDFGNNFEYHIFGDDIDYLEKKVPELFKYLNYKIIKNLDTIEAFEELKTYKNYISSNSTFCWWAIILNKNKNLKVVGPVTWMNQKYDIHRPDNWKLISNKV